MLGKDILKRMSDLFISHLHSICIFQISEALLVLVYVALVGADFQFSYYLSSFKH